jgi:hypothetical protein
VSIWATILDFEENPPYAYQGSHVLPSTEDPRDEGWSVHVAQVPSHITRDGRDDQPEDGAPWPWLRLSMHSDNTVLDRGQVTELHAVLGAWLEQTGGGR